MNGFINYLILLGVFLLSCNSANISTINSNKPNIILLLTDDQGWGDVGYKNHPHLETPNIDALAAKGVILERFYAASPVCSPTRGSVLTGRHPLRYGIKNANDGHLNSEEYTLAELVKGHGYNTGHFGKWHLGTLTKTIIDSNRGGRIKYREDYSPPWQNGFDFNFSTEAKVPTWNPMICPDPNLSGGAESCENQGDKYGTAYWKGVNEIETTNLEGDDSKIIMDRVIPFIEQSVVLNKNFLAVVWFHTPHLPVISGQQEKSIYGHLSEDKQHYYGAISALDKQIGRLRWKLDQLGVTNNTIVFYASDNGPAGKNTEHRTQGTTNGLRGRKGSLYEGGIRVPAFIVWPDEIESGITNNTPCFTSDYFPTIASILGDDIAKFNRPYDGIDILPLIHNKIESRNKDLIFKYGEQVAIIHNEYKLYSSNGGSSFNMYNLANDISEMSDIRSSHMELYKSMKQGYKEWEFSRLKSLAGGDY